MFSRYCCPPILWTLLDDYEVAQCNHINRSLHHETQKELAIRRSKRASFIFELFYVPTFSLFTTEKTLRHDLDRHVRVLFRLLPELFVFLHEHDIMHLDLSMVYSHSKHAYVMIMSHNELADTARSIFDYVKSHHSIQYFQYSIFSPILTMEMVEDIVHHHPLLTVRAMRRRTFKPSTVLYANAYHTSQNLE
jgi:hypothetical protein